MAEVGSIEIAGSIDETDIVAGLDRITDQLKEMENQFNQVNPPMARTAGFASKLGKSLITIGATGVAAMTALATKSPVLASTFAKIGVSTLKLSNTIGRQLKPAFEGANTLIMSLNSALLDHDSTVSAVAGAVGESFEDIGRIITGQWTEIQGIIPKGAGVAMGIKLGMPFGLPGMLAGAALGYIAGSIVAEPTVDISQEKTALEQALVPDLPGIPQDRMPSGEIIPLSGMYLPAVDLAKSLWNMVFNAVQKIDSGEYAKDQELSTANGKGRYV